MAELCYKENTSLMHIRSYTYSTNIFYIWSIWSKIYWYDSNGLCFSHNFFIGRWCYIPYRKSNYQNYFWLNNWQINIFASFFFELKKKSIYVYPT